MQPCARCVPGVSDAGPIGAVVGTMHGGIAGIFGVIGGIVGTSQRARGQKDNALSAIPRRQEELSSSRPIWLVPIKARGRSRTVAVQCDLDEARTKLRRALERRVRRRQRRRPRRTAAETAPKEKLGSEIPSASMSASKPWPKRRDLNWKTGPPARSPRQWFIDLYQS
jgi:hypothetical protein